MKEFDDRKNDKFFIETKLNSHHHSVCTTYIHKYVIVLRQFKE